MKKFRLMFLAFSLQILAQQQPIGPESSAHSCGLCDVLPGPVAITCERGRAQPEKTQVKLAATLRIAWKAEGDWQVKFTRTPCKEGSVFNQGNAVCVIKDDAMVGRYQYTVSLAGCKRHGTAVINVIKP